MVTSADSRVHIHNSVKDWLYGITLAEPSLDDFPPRNVFEAESILSVYHLVNWSTEIGGAGIVPGHGKTKNVTSIFPMHDKPANTALLKHLSQLVVLGDEDLDHIRDLFGSKVAFYFAFMQTYFLFLFFPAIVGVLTFQFLPKCSLTFAIVNLLGCVVFLEYWKIKQADLSMRWNVKGVGPIKVNRPNFHYETTVVEASGRIRHYYPKWKAIMRQILQLPFFLVALVVLGAIIMAVFAIEVIISEEYEGPWKRLLVCQVSGLVPPPTLHILTVFAGICTDRYSGHFSALYELLSRRHGGEACRV